jgi:hypothetical protein
MREAKALAMEARGGNRRSARERNEFTAGHEKQEKRPAVTVTQIIKREEFHVKRQNHA